MTDIDKCREDFEDYVNGCIKAHAHEEFLSVGSPHWLAFKAGWVAAQPQQERDQEGETGIISRMAEARSYDNQPPMNDGLDYDDYDYDDEDQED